MSNNFDINTPIISNDNGEDCLNLLFPCIAIEVNFALAEDLNLSIFDTTILKLLGLGVGNKNKFSNILDLKEEIADSISELLCLKREIVIAILESLKRKQFINDDCELKAKAAKFLEKDGVTKDIITVKMLIEQSSGKLIDYYIEGREFANVKLNPDGKSFTKKIRNEDKKISNLHIIKASNASNFIPSKSDIYRAALSFIKKKVLNAKFSNNSNGDALSYNLDFSSISIVHSSREEVFLHVALSINRYGEHHLRDPFALGVSGFFYDVFEELRSRNSNGINTIFNDFLKSKIKDKIKENRSDSEKSYIPKNDIEKDISEALKHYKSCSYFANSLSDEKQNQYQSSNFIAKIYRAIEYALLDLATRDCNATTARFDLNNKAEEKIKLYLVKQARQLGFNVVNDSILKLSPNKLIYAAKYTPSLSALLGYNILLASYEPKHKFRSLSENSYKMLFEYLTQLRNFRNTGFHSAKENNIGSILLAKYKDFILSFLKEICPSLPIDKLELDNNTSYNNDTNLEIKTLFSSEFPKDKYNISQKLETALAHLFEKDINEANSLSSTVMDLARVMEVLLDERIAAIADSSIKDVSQLRQVSLENAKRYFDMELPPSISHTATAMLSKRFYGKKSTLGAAVLVYLATAKDKLLKLKDSDFLNALESLIDLRGHNNRNEDILAKIKSEDEVSLLKEKIYKIIKIMTER